MLTDTSLNATQLVGMFVFAVAALCAAAATGRHASTNERTSWRSISIVHGLFCLEVWLGFRHSVHDLVNSVLQSLDLYRDRALTQTVVLGILCLLGLVLIMAIWRSDGWRRQISNTTQLALVCTAGLVLLFLVETVSLHAIDRILYYAVGPVLLIAWAWAALALMVALLAIRSRLGKPL